MTSAKQIRQIIEESKPNTLFVCKDFSSITNNKNVKVIINRLVNEGTLKRLIDGIYYKPKYLEEAGEYVPISIYKFVDKIASIYNWNICPAGEAALNYLGLSNQVISKYIFKSDGPYRKYNIDGINVFFKHTNNTSIKNMSLKTAIVIEALRYTGKDKITNDKIMIIKKALTKDEKIKLLSETRITSSWLYEIIKTIGRFDE